MKQGDKSLHPFVIAPKTFIRRDAEGVSERDDRDKCDDSITYQRKFWPVFGIADGKHPPKPDNNFSQNSEREIFPRNERKIH